MTSASAASLWLTDGTSTKPAVAANRWRPLLIARSEPSMALRSWPPGTGVPAGGRSRASCPRASIAPPAQSRVADETLGARDEPGGFEVGAQLVGGALHGQAVEASGRQERPEGGHGHLLPCAVHRPEGEQALPAALHEHRRQPVDQHDVRPRPPRRPAAGLRPWQ